MELITIATERIEEGELYPEDASPEEEEAERIEVIVEELVRCELLGLEKNPIAWETLDQLVRPSFPFSTSEYPKGIKVLSQCGCEHSGQLSDRGNRLSWSTRDRSGRKGSRRK